jgi:hypothetical protein
VRIISVTASSDAPNGIVTSRVKLANPRISILIVHAPDSRPLNRNAPFSSVVVDSAIAARDGDSRAGTGNPRAARDRNRRLLREVSRRRARVARDGGLPAEIAIMGATTIQTKSVFMDGVSLRHPTPASRVAGSSHR